MKRLIRFLFLIGLILFSSVSMLSQSRIGIKSGLNISNIKGDYGRDLTTKFKGGFNLGFFANLRVGGDMYIQPELSFSQKGYLSSEYEIEHALSYLDFPFLLKLITKEGTGFHLGPQISFLILSAYQEGEYPTYFSKEGINPYNLSLCFGLNQRLGSLIEIGARYNYGFSRIMVPIPGIKSTSPDRVFQLYIGVFLNSIKK